MASCGSLTHMHVCVRKCAYTHKTCINISVLAHHFCKGELGQCQHTDKIFWPPRQNKCLKCSLFRRNEHIKNGSKNITLKKQRFCCHLGIFLGVQGAKGYGSQAGLLEVTNFFSEKQQDWLSLGRTRWATAHTAWDGNKPAGLASQGRRCQSARQCADTAGLGESSGPYISFTYILIYKNYKNEKCLWSEVQTILSCIKYKGTVLPPSSYFRGVASVNNTVVFLSKPLCVPCKDTAFVVKAWGCTLLLFYKQG